MRKLGENLLGHWVTTLEQKGWY